MSATPRDRVPTFYLPAAAMLIAADSLGVSLWALRHRNASYDRTVQELDSMLAPIDADFGVLHEADPRTLDDVLGPLVRVSTTLTPPR